MTTPAQIQSICRAQEVLAQVTFPGFEFIIRLAEGGNRFFLQAQFHSPCAVTGSVTLQKTRKWLLSEHQTESELVQTALKCVLTAIEHEAREQFKYQGQAIFGPHFNVNDLVALAKTGSKDVRDEVPS